MMAMIFTYLFIGAYYGYVVEIGKFLIVEVYGKKPPMWLVHSLIRIGVAITWPYFLIKGSVKGSWKW